MSHLGEKCRLSAGETPRDREGGREGGRLRAGLQVQLRQIAHSEVKQYRKLGDGNFKTNAYMSPERQCICFNYHYYILESKWLPYYLLLQNIVTKWATFTQGLHYNLSFIRLPLSAKCLKVQFRFHERNMPAIYFEGGNRYRYVCMLMLTNLMLSLDKQRQKKNSQQAPIRDVVKKLHLDSNY